ncbi:MAG: carboxypeptidase regulatory-like domain-containing protein [Candidatus Paceibacterota bacterium]
MFCLKIKKLQRGFSLVEVLVGSAIFLIVAMAVYGSFVSLLQLASGSQARTLATQLVAEQFEIIRNMPYVNVGLTTGIPLGVLPQTQTLTRGGMTFDVGLTIRNINLSTSSVQASSKLVEINVDCSNCKNFRQVSLTGLISPANLQSAGNGGALVVQVFNGNGEPVQGATVSVQSVATSSVTNVDITNNSGILNIIGVPPGEDMYKIIVTKEGYSTEETYSLAEVSNPTKPNVTVLNQEVSPISFSIDKLSSLHFSSVTPLCVPVGNVDFSMVGAKEIGAGIPKYSQNLSTNASGLLNLSSMEWDTYTITPTDGSYDVAGINPDSPFSLNPDNSQNVQIVVVPKDSNSLMVSVLDSATNLPISGAVVELSKTGYYKAKVTGEGYLSQSDWSGGSGQDMYVTDGRYFTDNNLVDTATSSGDILLKDLFGSYDVNATGTLESSIFDTGTTSNFYTISWNPNSQPILSGETSVKMQFATNASSSGSAWNYFGPDGTSGTYYTVPGSPINIVHNGDEYVRYKTYLTTETATVTPKVSDVFFSYTSACLPPGQVIFQGLLGDEYTLTVTKSGYATQSKFVTIGSGWQKQTILMSL